MSGLRAFAFRFMVVLAIITIPFAAFADKVGKAAGGGNSIEWQTSVTGHNYIELRVLTPSGDLLVSKFTGKNPTFSVKDLGNDVEDGQYDYELVVVEKFSADVAKKLEKARAANDEAAAKKVLKDAGIAETRVQSGTFTIQGSMIVSPSGTESDANDSATVTRGAGVSTTAAAGRPAFKPEVNDQVIPDDLIVQSSACVGFDCVDGESFGFDTLRLKENNLRIKFDDTSSSAGYPANDWQITANDDQSGGANQFSIMDVTNNKVPLYIQANAPSSSVYIDSTGRVGFGTATPGLELHVTNGDTPALRLEQPNTGGFTAQTWDIGGNEANFFVRDLTGGSRLPFRIRPGAPTSSIDVAASGNVGIGTASPSADLHVYADATADANLTLGTALSGPAFNISYNGSSFGRSAAALNVRPDASAVAPNPSLRFYTADVQRVILDNEGFMGMGTVTNPDAPIHWSNGTNTARLSTSGVWQDSSSRKAKENIVELGADEALATLNGLEPVKYNYKVAPEDGKVGFIAEDVPELVAVPTRDGLSALDIVGVLTKVVQEQQKTIETLAKEVESLKNNQ